MRVLNDDLSDTKKIEHRARIQPYVFKINSQFNRTHRNPPLLDERQIVLQQQKDNGKTLLKHFSLLELLVSPKEPYKRLLVR